MQRFGPFRLDVAGGRLREDPASRPEAQALLREVQAGGLGAPPATRWAQVMVAARLLEAALRAQ